MTTNTTTAEYIIDARGKRLGRVATEAASVLIGKHDVAMTRNKITPVQVVIQNVKKLRIDEKKRSDKTYDRYSGYPDGRKVLSMEKVIEQKGYTEIVRKAVYGMLPSNRLRAPRMKQLTIHE
jgi:large subunit ribosomal protein L13